MRIIPALWNGEPVTFHGKYYELNNALCMPALNPPPRLIAAASLPRTAHLAGLLADGVNFTWYYRERIPRLFAALDEGLKESGRTRQDFDCSLHVSWQNLQPDPKYALTEWEQLGFSRVIVYVTPPFPVAEISELASLIKQYNC